MPLGLFQFGAETLELRKRRLAEIVARLPEQPEITVEYFVLDERKAGGAYVAVTGRVRHVSVPERVLVMADGTVIPLDDIASLSPREEK